MSEENTTNPDAAAALAENATLRSTLAALQADNASHATTLAETIRERDTYKAQAAELEPRAKLAAELETKVIGYVNAGRETALVEALRAKLPGAEPLAIRGVLTTLHEAKRINKFAEDAAAEVLKAYPIIAAEAASLTRPPTSGGGSAGAVPVLTRPPVAVSLFRS